MRSATSIGANYREANRAESKADFIHKLGISTKEAAETEYWLELINESKNLQTVGTQALLKESGELIAILITIARNTNIRNAEYFHFLRFNRLLFSKFPISTL